MACYTQIFKLDRATADTAVKSLLAAATALGVVRRQEIASMLPPTVLDPWPGQLILDLCASPGSKTCQILDMLACRQGGALQTAGLLVANDVSAKRLDILRHQIRYASPVATLVTNFDGAEFPTKLLFDRVLCDVPCSCDGTLKKNLDIWEHFSPLQGAKLHSKQLKILSRGLALLKPGGILVYSTCSLNPMENEAVVAQALQTFAPDVALVDF
uniref:Multisite-specific tRNA:(Cytosine-C(5))-methyltransferase-like n=1 Tax=Dermatophagoides pteronyssinus TaxID=6956 RepID=A0A6P6Y5Q7_DERPT|nr:multisite-specific tRNA:(cytosine-C(5))-methyltransferase-like [Dermatophagoides pteronyssinus]